ncbi:receptor-type tyrosine-protein phosphatase U-like [Saccostrea echinata]|uniref:receptor-type tyrosine-protein phosphatase U-like n=1 Tax=Saccostrea echinata TaxID=191078 RepID=UPI002A800ACD|nr:receptor-type tyrosine-protein phosphatase U-like [Saccostrea echinata]
MRKHRMNMIQGHEQYKMVYETLNEAFRAKHNLVNRDEFVEKYGGLKNDASDSSTELAMEYKTLKALKPIYSESDLSTAKENLERNFSPDILPVDKYHCHLTYVKGQSNYYNAVLLQSYTRPDALISAQFPAAGSTESLFRLLKDFDTSVIVALSSLTDIESVYTNSFLPQEQSSITVGSFILTHKSTLKTPNVSKTKLVLRKKVNDYQMFGRSYLINLQIRNTCTQYFLFVVSLK